MRESQCGICKCGHALSRHEFYTNTLHGCKDCPGDQGWKGCTYYRPAINET